MGEGDLGFLIDVFIGLGERRGGHPRSWRTGCAPRTLLPPVARWKKAQPAGPHCSQWAQVQRTHSAFCVVSWAKVPSRTSLPSLFSIFFIILVCILIC